MTTSFTSIISDKKYLSAILVIVPLFILAFLGMYPYSFTLTNFNVGIFILCLQNSKSVLLFLTKYAPNSFLPFFLKTGKELKPLKNLLNAFSP